MMGPAVVCLALLSRILKISTVNSFSEMLFFLQREQFFIIEIVSSLFCDCQPPINNYYSTQTQHRYYVQANKRKDDNLPKLNMIYENGIYLIFVKFGSSQYILQMKVLGCIGTGSFGKVLKVEIDGSHFAVKKIQLEFDCEDDSWEIQQVKKQAQILSACLYHPNIVRYYSSFRQGDHYFIAMEYVDGHPLSSIQLPIQSQTKIISFIIQLLFALRYLKRVGIIHRDLKPSNILFSEKGLFKIVDFGISKKLNKSLEAASCLGTPYYTAPEIIAEEKYDFKVDIWSFGVILYEVCHGKLPFLGNTMQQLKRNIKNQHPLLRNDLHDDIKLIIRGCLTKNPHKRFTIEQMLKLPLINQQILKEIKNKEKDRNDFN